ncbi:MAG: hypothetical protein HC809_08975 [Gammaproteobacteria bacterium]|nr:hypothetical protein [Gammaproteobacteria bacterium]
MQGKKNDYIDLRGTNSPVDIRLGDGNDTIYLGDGGGTIDGGDLFNLGSAGIEGQNIVTGAIGISVTGTWANRDSAVTVSRPAFGDLSTQVMVLNALGSY